MSIKSRLKLQANAGSESVNLSLYQALDPDLNEFLQESIYPPKAYPDHPVDLPKHLATFGERGNKPGQFDIVEGMVTDAEGNLYVIDRLNQRVQVIDKDGKSVKIYGGNEPLVTPVDVRIDNNENVFALDAEQKAVVVFDKTARITNKFILPANALPKQMAWGSDGTLLIVDRGNRILRLTADGQFKESWGSTGTGKVQFNGAMSIAVNKTGVIAVADSLNQRIQLLQADGTFKKNIGGAGSDLGFPSQIEITDQGNICLAAGYNVKDILILNKDGETQTRWSEPDVSNIKGALAADSLSNLYVVLPVRKIIQRYKADFSPDSWTIAGRPSDFAPYSICIDKNNNRLWGLATMNYIRSIFAVDLATGTIVRQVAYRSGQNDSIAVTSTGEVLVIRPDNGFTEVRRYNSDGKYLGNIGKEFSFGASPYSCSLVASSFSSELLVHDTNSYDYFRFDAQLNYLGMLSEQLPTLGKNFMQADRFIFLKNGFFIMNKDYRLRKFDKNGAEVAYGNWDAGVIRNRGEFLSPVTDSNETIYAIVSNRVIKIDSAGNDDLAWGEAVNLINIPTGQAQRFTEIRLLSTDGKALYVLGRSYASSNWELWKISFDGKTFTQLQPANVNYAGITRMAVSPQGELYVSISGQSLYKFTASMTPDTVWTANAASVMPASTGQVSRQVMDMKAAADGSLSLFLYENSAGVLVQVAENGTPGERLGGKQTFKASSNLIARPDTQGGVWMLDLTNQQNRILHFSAGSLKAPDQVLDAVAFPAVNQIQDFFFSASKFLVPEMVSGFIQLNWYPWDAATKKIGTKTQLIGKNFFITPSHVAFDNSERLWVIDYGDKKVVHRLNKDSHQKEATYELPAGTGMGFDISMTFNASGVLFISDRAGHKMYSFDEATKVWTQRLTQLLSTAGPAGMVMDVTGNLFLAEANNKRVSRINLNTSERSLGFTGKSPFPAPMDIAISEDKLMYILDTQDNAVLCVDMKGSHKWKVAYESKSLLRIASAGKDMITILFKNKSDNRVGLGMLSPATGSLAAISGDLTKYNEASCIAFSSKGEIILGGQNFIACFDLKPDQGTLYKVEWKWEVKEFSISFYGKEKYRRQVKWVQDIAVDADGFIYFTQANATDGGGTYMLNNTGKYISSFGHWPHEQEKTLSPTHVAIAADGTIYVNEELNHRIKKYGPWTGKPAPPPRKQQEIIAIDNRPRYLSSAFRNINQRYQLTKNFFDALNRQFEVLDPFLTDAGVFEELESQHRKAFREFLIAEGALNNAREQLAALGLDYLSPETSLIIQLDNLSDQQEAILHATKTRISGYGSGVELRSYRQTDTGYVDQFGISLYNYLSELNKREIQTKTEDDKERWLIIPAGILPGSDIPATIYFIRNPRFSGKKIHPPSFVFEERYRLETSWKGAGLGEFAHSISLTPGESKELVITTEKKLSWEETSATKSKTTLANSKEQEFAVTRKDNFQSSLNNAFESKSVLETSDKNDSSVDSTSTTSVDFKIKLPLDLFSFGPAVTNDFTNKNKREVHSTKSNTLTDISKKVTDVVRKTSKDVSERNKLTFSSTSEEEIERKRKSTGEDIELHTRKIKVENINEGKTVNYLFFQVTNRYATNLWLDNLNLHIATGVELIENTGLTLERHLPAVNFDELLHDEALFTGMQREEMVKAIGVGILRRYVSETGFADNLPRIIRIESSALRTSPLDRNDIKDLITQSLYADEATMASADFQKQLLEFAKLDMVIKPLDIGEQESATVNSGQFYVDTQIGFNQATEEYLEDRRRIETDRHQALLEEEVARVRAGVFFPPMPEGITHLTTEIKKN